MTEETKPDAPAPTEAPTVAKAMENLQKEAAEAKAAADALVEAAKAAPPKPAARPRATAKPRPAPKVNAPAPTPEVTEVAAKAPGVFTPGIVDIARLAHEANRGYCAALGDRSQLPWDEAPDWQRASAINGVLHVEGNPDATPGDSHRNWLAEKDLDGWKYGPVKDAEAKVHPCFLPFEELPPEQQAKDYIFLAVVRAGLSTLTHEAALASMPDRGTFPTEGDNFTSAASPAPDPEHGTFAWACLQAAAGMIITREGGPDTGIHFAGTQGRTLIGACDLEATDWQTVTVW